MNYQKLYVNSLYLEDLDYLSRLDLPWENMDDSVFLISGATGMIGSMIIDTLMLRNRKFGTKNVVIAVGRSVKKLTSRFAYWNEQFDKTLFLRKCDINQPIGEELISGKIDYIIHLASSTHPVAYSTDPVGTVLANVYGTKNLLDLAVRNRCKRFVFASSNEIYGENRGDVEFFDESYCGYIDSNTLRAGYPESKRCGEALCQAYKKQYEQDVVVSRFTRTYGPTLLPTDTKALSQFINNALNKENIVLKSKGHQYFSYTYVSDAVAGLLTILLCGENGEAYNIADEQSDIKLCDLASLIAKNTHTEVVFDLPDAVEMAGFSKATKARLSSEKLKALGWKLKYPIASGIERVLKIFSDIR